MPSKGKPVKKCSNESSKMKEANTANTSNTNTCMSLTPNVEHQFEAELCWCIQQIQIALKSKKLNNKQEQDHKKAFNTLMSNTAPLVKKRQIMRLSFGDYRSKMAAEDKKHSRNAVNMKVKQTVPSKKSIFVKKANFASLGIRFSSDPCNSDELDNDLKNEKIESSKDCYENKKNFTFVPSDNNFRFSFDVSENL